MSSVVNKSKGKFAPKAKLRARPVAATTGPSASQDPSPSSASSASSQSQQVQQVQQAQQQQQEPTLVDSSSSAPNLKAASPIVEKRLAVVDSPPGTTGTARKAPTLIAAPGARKPTLISIPTPKSKEKQESAREATAATPTQTEVTEAVPTARGTSEVQKKTSTPKATRFLEQMETSGDKMSTVMKNGDYQVVGMDERRGEQIAVGKEPQNTFGGEEIVTFPAEKQLKPGRTKGHKEPKASRKRKAAAADASEGDSKGLIVITDTAAAKERPKRRRRMAKPRVDGTGTADEAGGNGEGVERERINVFDEYDDGDFEEAATIEEETEELQPKSGRTETAKGSAKPRQPKKLKQSKPDGRVGFLGVAKTRSRREESPEDDGDRRLEESKVLMKDLCRDPQIGRKSKRFVELAEMDWNDVVKKQQDTRKEIQSRIENGENVHVETPEERIARIAAEKEAQRSRNNNHGAPQMRIVNGEFVIDEETLRVDRHERDAIQAEDMEIIEEDSNTRLVNSNTFSKRERTERWEADEISLFYEGLSMFGTDFTMLAGLFPKRSRRQIKNKFNVEERKDPLRITMALKKRIPIDMKEYSEVTSTEFRDPQELKDELQAMRDEHDKQMEQHKEHVVAMEKERQDQANAAMQAEMNAEPNGDIQPKGKRKRGKKADAAARGEQIIPMSIEEYEAERRKREEEEAW